MNQPSKPKMKMRLFTFVLLSVLCFQLHSQTLEMPRRSPRASTQFTVGLTDVKIEYSSPALRDREVWGELVPFDQLWRAGANEATVISFSRDVLVQGEALAAGEYAFFLIPREGENWIAIFNRNPEQWGSYDYDESLDVLRVEVAVDTLCTAEERLQYYLSDTDLDAGSVCLRWERRSVCLDFSVPVLEQIERRLENKLAEASAEDYWRLYAEVADFLKSYQSFLPEAESYAIESTARFDNSWNWWLRAQIESDLGNYTSAVISAEKAIEVGANTPEDRFFQNSQPIMEASLQHWRELAND